MLQSYCAETFFIISDITTHNGRFQGQVRENLGRQVRGDAQGAGCQLPPQKGRHRVNTRCVPFKIRFFSIANRTFIAVCDITEEGGEWTIKTSTTLKTMELKFKVRDNRIIDLLAALDIIQCRIFPEYLNATTVFEVCKWQFNYFILILA